MKGIGGHCKVISPSSLSCSNSAITYIVEIQYTVNILLVGKSSVLITHCINCKITKLPASEKKKMETFSLIINTDSKGLLRKQKSTYIATFIS